MKQLIVLLFVSLFVAPAMAEIDRVITGNASIQGCIDGGGKPVDGSRFGMYLLCDGGRFHGYMIYVNRPLTLNNYPASNFKCVATRFEKCEHTGVGTQLKCGPYEGSGTTSYDIYLLKANLSPNLAVRMAGWFDRSNFLADPISGGKSEALIWKKNDQSMDLVRIDIYNWAGKNKSMAIEGTRFGDSDQTHGGGFELQDGTTGRRIYKFSTFMLLKDNDLSEDGTSIREREGGLSGNLVVEITERKLGAKAPVFKYEVYNCTSNSDHP